MSYKRGEHVTFAGNLAKYRMSLDDGSGECIITLVPDGQAIVNEADLTPGWPPPEVGNEVRTD